MQVYILWNGNNFVEVDGSREPEYLIGVFSSLGNINEFLAVDNNVFQLSGNFKGKRLEEPHKKIYHEGKTTRSYIYFTVENLDKPF